MSPRKLFCCAVLTLLASTARGQVALDRLPLRIPEAKALLLADAFDFPVGKPDAAGYYKARGFSLGDHPGEDWDGIGGGNSDFNDAVSSIGNGVVVYAQDAHFGWGNVVIVRHQFREAGAIQTVDAFFGHLNTIRVHSGERVTRGEQLGTIGTAHGLYPAHLHFEIRKNLDIGINRAASPQNFSCYCNPSKFIAEHRRFADQLAGEAEFACARTLFLASRRKAIKPLTKPNRSGPGAY